MWVWRSPESFRAVCARPRVACFGEPVTVLQRLFYGLKGIQLGVFFAWCYFYGGGSPAPFNGSSVALAVGGALIVAGQILNLSVFHRLGAVGVFYGNKFGYQIPWYREFPFSLLHHPQYVGTMLSIWGFFLVMRFPHDDWYVLPTLETGYYVLGAYFEQ
ncbi:MAG: hypothetical protein HY268_03290 [Deltaproteobacteria bacterium]|nr:hypothetical protein [Deltaproteobacteria bacterium]